MKRPAIVELSVFAVLFAGGTLTRLVLQDIPNFAPVAAISLFAGFYFRSAILAALLPLSIMLTSDYWIGGYDWQMMLLVYFALGLPVAARGLMRKYFTAQKSMVSVSRVVGLVGSSFVASCLFFLITNFGSWLWFDMYERTAAGLVECYVSALPFFRYTLMGDLFFACVLFSLHAFVVSMAHAKEEEVSEATAQQTA